MASFRSPLRFGLLAVVLSLFFGLVPCQAAELSTASRAEIDALLERLGESGCQFNRNGTWYGAAEAKAHLALKLHSLLDRKLVGSAEEFIERAASSSSMTGSAYLVSCQPDPPLPSAAWLTRELQALRAKSHEVHP